MISRGLRVLNLWLFGRHKERFELAGYVITLDTNEAIQRGIYLDSFESEETKWLYSVLKPGMTVVDAGSNIGYYSLISSSLVGDKGKVYSFDPSNYAFEKLCDSLRENDIKNIIVYKAGLSDVTENRELLIRDETLHSPSFYYDGDYKTTSLGVSSLITLDQFAADNHLDYIDLIKIDVEGYEFKIMSGMERLLQQKRVHRIIIEFNGYWLKKAGTSPEEMKSLFKFHGFEEEYSKKYPLVPGDGSVENFMYVNKSFAGK